MKIWLKERIGNPELFTGRKKDLSYFLNWIDNINFERSNSSAILSRRKTGKTALMQRLFNITFNKNENVVPFYFEIRETDQWLADFAEEFFLTFVYQFIAFKTRKLEYMDTAQMGSFKNAAEIARKEGFEYLESVAVNALGISREGKTDRLWNVVRETPRMAALHYNMYIVQMIDEFQFINRYIFWDKEKNRRAHNLAGSYLHTCEYKNAPLLVSGSWVGWLTRALQKMLPGRFQFHYMDNISQEEAIEMILKYSYLENIPVTEKTVNLLAGITEGNPFYIGSMFRSKYFEKDFTTEKGVLETLEYETLHKEGTIRGTWMEYVLYALDEVNNVNAKKIVLYLCKNREREVNRREIKEELGLEMSDSELEKKLRILVKADIIEQGLSNFDYQGVPDNIFDKIFRGVYQKEIETFDPRELSDEYRELAEKLQKNNKSLMGEYSHFKGKFAEYLIIDNLKYRAHKNQDFYKNMISNLPEDFQFAEYETVWSYSSSPVYKKDIQIDIFAKAKDSEYSLIGEVKHRRAKFSVQEAEIFVKKAGELKKLEHIEKTVLFVFSSNGFFKNTIRWLEKNSIAWSDDKSLLKRRF
ncbi:NTP hydrolase p-loop-containing [Desulfonema limicola]|uniref:NTP hydrolase p-loop-containing n=1 Tax=Desulfonema limicola TaxID=45656 RepID=A0A975B351_9BACT|nr:hypothetical protein [Desulfonema limicola]QTA77920.1 NTP hydrolase p-loop-containing [Desulfonema limicola]